jgi:agmatine deiminase
VTDGLIPEWGKQQGIILAFAHKQTDWIDYLEDVRKCTVDMAVAISQYEEVYLLCQDAQEAGSYFRSSDNIKFIECDFNDTWMRDCSVLSLKNSSDVLFKGFKFTAWGGKFEADLDNQLKYVLEEKGLYRKLECFDYILEGGAIESDGEGTIMTTSSCLLNANRNAHATKKSVSEDLAKYLDAKQVLFLDNGYLVGDDTDGHIDTLARFCDEKTIAYVGLPSRDDEHYETFLKMQEELKSFRNIDGEAYDLMALPFVPAMYDDGERLPATYANFLIINDAVLVPTYGFDTDDSALKIITDIFPNRKVIGIDCRVLVKQHGSLHCMTMQIAAS